MRSAGTEVQYPAFSLDCLSVNMVHAVAELDDYHIFKTTATLHTHFKKF